MRFALYPPFFETAMRRDTTPEEINALLPQTQCELCGYKGCMPYAEAIALNQAPINLCPPGGVKGLIALGNLVNENPEPFIEDMKKKEKPLMRAIIREAECIGCTICIQACPVDAILGAAKLMHTVIGNECTGCERCIAPCPVDCIDLVATAEPAVIPALAQKRYEAKKQRLVTKEKNQIKQKMELERKAYVKAAIERTKIKNSSRLKF
jgi:Na+-translocating ferredoxin:NAD+ oxidoreductase subunit B